MRILLLTVLFVFTFYYFTKEENTEVASSSIDSIKLKMGAPHRINNDERSPASKTGFEVIAPVIKVEAKEQESEDMHILQEDPRIVLAEALDSEHMAAIELEEIEEGWNHELKGLLDRLEPLDSEEIHKAYMIQQEFYASELSSLLNEKQQKIDHEASMELDYLINQLDQNHQYKLQEILGAHYEAVSDHYQYYLDTAEANR